MTCYYRYNYFESDEFYALALHILSAFQVPLDIMGFYIVIRKTPKQMERVKFSMLILHSVCTWIDVYYNILAIPLLIYPAVSGYPLGILLHLKVPTSVQVYIGLVSLFLLFAALVLFFEDRYNRLVRRDPDSPERNWKRVVHFALNFFLGFIAIAPLFLIAQEDQEKAVARIHNLFPCLPPDTLRKPGFYNLNENAAVLVYCFLLGFLFYLPQFLFFISGTIRQLFRTTSQSQKTLKMQRSFFKSLCIQAAVPVGAMMLPFLYLNVSTFVSHVDILLGNIAMILFTTHGIFSTLTMLCVHKAYRDATIAVFKCRKKTSTTTSPLRVSVTKL